MKVIKQTSKFTQDITKSRQKQKKEITNCMPKTAVSPNFKAHQLGLAGPN